ncbi:Hypothetical predicted protein [Scomber scombrus]|uniref:Uncharacterized protein n=1 Tax=Scomber scombrus TaxID=13677 RepID=A0AAV1P747_SCOSC
MIICCGGNVSAAKFRQLCTDNIRPRRTHKSERLVPRVRRSDQRRDSGGAPVAVQNLVITGSSGPVHHAALFSLSLVCNLFTLWRRHERAGVNVKTELYTRMENISVLPTQGSAPLVGIDVSDLIRYRRFIAGDTVANNYASPADDDDDDADVGDDCSHSCWAYLHFLSGDALSRPTPSATALSQHIACPVITVIPLLNRC